jgi:hypothetical protein
MNREAVEDKVATAACAVSLRLEEAEPAIKACMALWDCVADAMHRDAICAADKPMAFAEDSIPGIAHYLGREYGSWEEVLKARPNWYLVRLAEMIRKKPPTIPPPCDGKTGAEMEEAQTMNEMERNYSSAVADANGTKHRACECEFFVFGAIEVLESWKRADRLIEALKAQSNRWKNRYEEKKVEAGDLFDSNTALQREVDKLNAYISKHMTILDFDSVMRANAKLALERDDAGKVFGRLGLVAKEIAGISDNAPSMECLDAILSRYKRVLKCADELHRMLRNRAVYPDHVINDFCDRAMTDLYPDGWKP